MPERSLDWLRQAEKDLEKAKLDIDSGFYEWACFTARKQEKKQLNPFSNTCMVKRGTMARRHYSRICLMMIVHSISRMLNS